MEIEELKSYMEKRPKKWLVKKINPSVPSLKAIHLETQILCDISITNGLAVHNSQLLAHVFSLQIEAVTLYHYIKHWLLNFDIRFKGFTLTLMVLFFLQQLGFMPSIKEVQKDIEPIEIDDFEVQFDNSRDRDYYKLKEMPYFRRYIKDFFSFYSNFDYDNYIICTYRGKAVQKKNYDFRIDYNHAITLAAPLLRRTNCAKYLTNLDLSKFFEAIQKSYNFLCNHPAAETFIYSREYLDFLKL
jgi:DNA polymerase sigma